MGAERNHCFHTMMHNVDVINGLVETSAAVFIFYKNLTQIKNEKLTKIS